MAKITDPDQLNVGVEITIDTTAQTFTLNVAGNLIAKDGVTIQALYSKFVELWTTSTYNKFEFPMYTIDSRSGQFIFGFDGSSYSGWKPANDATRQMLRDGGWSEFSSAGVLNRQYVGVVALASGFPVGAQFYYQKQAAGPALNFTFDDAPNEGIQVYGDSSNGNFDTRTFFKLFSREYSYTYDDAVLGDIGETSTAAFKIALPLSVSSDLKIQNTDAFVETGSPYTSISAVYYPTPQTRAIGGSNYLFNIILSGASASAEDIYTKTQYLLRQTGDIDSGPNRVTGKTADSLCHFVGDTLYTASGVYIDSYASNDINRLVFQDVSGQERSEPYTAAGSLNFNSFLYAAGTGGYYRMYFTSLPAYRDYGTTGAVTVQNATGAAIAGPIISGVSSVDWTFSYDTNSQSGHTPATDTSVTVVAGNAGYAKPVVTAYTITRAVGQGISLVAEQDRAYTT